jgi:glutaredoxin
MEFEEPVETGFTIYSKSGCKNCIKVKKLLDEKRAINIKICCDEYLIEDKINFIYFILNKTKQSNVVFPIVFNNGVYVGGYAETNELLYKTLCFDEQTDF